MCGIIAYLGERRAEQILVDGLKRLEYRGYDSAGVALNVSDDDSSKGLIIRKKKGKVKNLEAMCRDSDCAATCGIAHTRWATHGGPSDRNSHPHTNTDNTIAVVHNGIIENYSTLKAHLKSKGYVFRSDTDTEVLAHLIDDLKKDFPYLSLEEIVSLALGRVVGTYGIAVIDKTNPNIMIGARMGSPLILGVGENELFLASDASAIVEHTRKVVYLKDGDITTLKRHGNYRINQVTDFVNEDGSPKNKRENRRRPSLLTHARRRSIRDLEMTLDAIEKKGHKHFMIKEILEQPAVIRNCFRGRIVVPGDSDSEKEISASSPKSDNSSIAEEKADIVLGGIEKYISQIASARRIIIAACGTSWHAGLVGEYLIEELARLPVEVEYASEFRYRKPILFKDDVVIVISQSGETADTLAAVKEAKAHGCLTIGFVNAVGSTIARETDAGCYLHVGPEIGVASTKAFTGQVSVLSMFALRLAKERNILTSEQLSENLEALRMVPDLMSEMLSNEKLSLLAKQVRPFRYCTNFLFLGRGFNFPVALEAALKLKEISYIHAEGYPAAEMKHGPIALIDESMPVVCIAPQADACYEKVKSNIEEVLARKGTVIVVTEEGNTDFDDMAEFVMYVPKCYKDWVFPLLAVIPMQLLSYYIADARGCSIDQPRNLAKSVTVE